MPTQDYPKIVINQLLAGTNDTKSAAFAHGIIEDIYGRDAIEGVFLANSAVLNYPIGTIKPGVLKVQLNPNVHVNPDPFRDKNTISIAGPTNGQETPQVTSPNATDWRQSFLSIEEDTYTGRVITFLEGPLKNQSYYILGYWGTRTTDSNGNSIGAASSIQYSIAIDLTETDRDTFEAVNGNSVDARTLQEWLALGVNRLIQDASNTPYEFLINDLPYNGFGIGIESDPNQPNFGNLDQGKLIPDPLGLVPNCNFSFSIPLALLPHYDFLNRSKWQNFDTGVLGTSSQSSGEVEVNGSSNEAFDVPDYHDHWLGYYPEGSLSSGATQPSAMTAEIIPSFHRPELVNYIAQQYAKAPSLNKYDLYRMVQLIDYACTRPLSYRLQDIGGSLPTIVRNLDFRGRLDGNGIPFLDIDVSNVSTAKLQIEEWVAKLIGRGTSATDLVKWDVDNQRTGTADAVWTDFNLPTVVAPDGRKLKVLVAPTILDLDSRLNINAIGDPIQGNAFQAVGSGSYHTTAVNGTSQALVRNGSFIAQGLGYGPAEISLAGFFNNPTPTINEANYVEFFRMRYGVDDAPGRALSTANPSDPLTDLLNRYFKERGLLNKPAIAPETAGNMIAFRGLQQSRRGQLAYGIDRFGNVAMSDSTAINARVYSNTSPTNSYPECVDDPYEARPNKPAAYDTNFGIDELEAVLRRFDSDVNALPDRLKSFLTDKLGCTNLNNAIYNSISSRSNELRYPNMAAISVHNVNYNSANFPQINNAPRNLPNGSPDPTSGPGTRVPTSATRLATNGRIEGSFLRWIQMLYSERYGASILEMEDVRLLFPMEFRKALRLDINRGFGNGEDDDTDNQIDDPEELSKPGEAEHFPSVSTTYTGEYSFGFPNYPETPSGGAMGLSTGEISRYIKPMASRKLLARQLYCLAQLVIDQNYPFGGLDPSDAGYQSKRARELAQWAVNVVDFRDSDGAMTRFEYDETPFTADGSDAFPSGHPRAGQPLVWLPEAGNVVWGMEFPELLLTESLAFHNKNIADTDKDNLSDPGTPAAPGPTLTTDPMNPDSDFDQLRIPQGSLFLELYCPRSTENTAAVGQQTLGAAPSGLYAGASPTLQLDALSPDDSSLGFTTGTYGKLPVFRIGISHPVRASGTNYPQTSPSAALSPYSFPATADRRHQTSSFATTAPGTLGTATGYNTTGLFNDDTTVANRANTIEFDRMIWFANLSGDDPSIQNIPDLDGTAADRYARVFHNRSGTPVAMEGGSYLVVGPRTTTYLGSTVQPVSPSVPPPVHSPSPQKIALNSTQVQITNRSGTITSLDPANASSHIKKCLTMIAASEPPAAWGPATPAPVQSTQGVGVNISEPLASAYYPMPGYILNSADNVGNGNPGVVGFASLPPDAYINYSSPGNTLPDVPFDYNPAINPVLAGTPTRYVSNTYLNERVAYLQRLADPELPYHPVFNPYVTIDWLDIDLTVFNGESNATGDPTDTAAYTNLAFQSRYKDGARITESPTSMTIQTTGGTRPAARQNSASAAYQTGISIFSSSTAPFYKTNYEGAATTALQPYFNCDLGVEDANASAAANFPNSSVSLGYLNQGRQIGTSTSTSFDGFGQPSTTATGNYVGSPNQVQAGLFWFNRNFVNPGELMLVPRTSPGLFGDSFTTPKGATPVDRYYLTTNPVKTDLPQPFGYLPAFFSTPKQKTAIQTSTSPYWQQPATPGASTGAGWELLLELIETQPPFLDSEKWIDPKWFVSGQTNNAPDYIRDYLLSTYKAPGNAFPTYRTPGKVNLNTVSRREVWDGLEWNYDQTARNLAGSLARSSSGGGPWEAVKLARRGYRINTNVGTFFTGSTRDWMINPFLDADTPSQFAGAFRPSFTAAIEPSEAKEIGGAPAITPPPRSMRRERSNMASLLRPTAGYAGGTSDPIQNNGSPTLNPPATTTPSPPSYNTNQSLVSADTSVGGTINEELALQPFVNYQRQMRLFNLTTNQSNVFAVWLTVGLFEYDEINGIGAEYIGSNGSPERTRSFYIIDRSIPVGFAPGKSYNSEKTILLRRKLPN
jgi:hypothetical protein